MPLTEDPSRRFRPIGGFFGLEMPRGPGGFLALWNATDRRRAFGNARSAFKALIDLHPGATVWLPAYICRELASVVPRERLRFFGVGSNLSPDTDLLRRDARRGDIILVVDYFGFPPPPSTIAFAGSRQDLIFIEDASQALDPEIELWADWRLFSPRKLMGVPDGGLLVPLSDAARRDWTNIVATTEPVDCIHEIEPSLARFEDEDEDRNHVWYALHSSKERRQTASDDRMTRLSWQLLSQLDPASQSAARRSNYDLLESNLRDWKLSMASASSGVPYGFPVEVPAETRPRLLDELHRRRVFAAVHWADLPSDAVEFKPEHELARRAITLPCDHRYDLSDMTRVVAAFTSAVA